MKNINKNAGRWGDIKEEKKTTSKDDKIVFNGIVADSLPNTMFQVDIPQNNTRVLCTLAGKLKQNRIRVLAGDQVTVEISLYDLTKGRIIWRR